MAKQWGALTLALGLMISGAAFANEGQKDKDIQQQSGQETMGVELEQQAGAEQKVNLSELSPEKVRQLQQKLQEQGFYKGEIDGKVGDNTKQAFFQYKQSKGHEVNLSIDEQIAQELELGNLSEIRQVRGEEKGEKELEPQKGMEHHEGAVTDPQAGMEKEKQAGEKQHGQGMPEVQPQRGMQAKSLDDLQPEQVRNIQMQLKQQGFYQGEVTGEVNQQTTQALEQFKKTKNLGAGATIDQRTAQALGIQLEQKQPVRGQEEKQPQKGMEQEGTESPDQGY